MARRPFAAPLVAACGLGVLAGTTPAASATPYLATPAGITAQTTAPSTAPTDGGRLMMLLDSSGSMSAPDATGRPKIESARTALHQVVNGLPSGAQAGMRVFGATVEDKTSPSACTDSQLSVPIGTGNQAVLNQAVDRYKPYGETPMAYAMQQAARDLGTTGKRSMILVSDGEDTCSPDPCQIAQQIADQGIDLKIDVVGFRVSGKAQKDLQCIATVGRGSYYDASNAQDLTASLKTLSTRAFRPFSVSGKPVNGTPIIDGAPVVTPGQWVSKIGENKDERYYQVKHTPGTTLHVSVAGRPVTRDDSGHTLGVAVRRTDGDSCFADDSTWSSDWRTTAMPIGAVARVDANDTECGHVENLTIKVTTEGGGRPQQTLGKDAMPFELRVVEERPVTNVPSLPAPSKDDPSPDSDWTYDLTGTPTTGGAGFSDAPRITPNTTYSGTLLPGEVQIFKVPVQYGQKLVARANVAPPSLQMRSTLGTSGKFLGVRLGLFNPERQSFSGYDSVSLSEYTDDRQDIASDTRQVTWRNRESYGSPSYLGGDYFIAVAAEDVAAGGGPVSFLIRGDVTGTPTGQPTYGEPGAVQPTAPDEDETPSPSPSSTPGGTGNGSTPGSTPTDDSTPAAAAPVDAGDDDGLPMLPLIAGGAVLLLALVSGGVWMAVRRKNAPAQDPGSIGQGWNQQGWPPPNGQ
ncbi:vWA domain-containing protein [Luteipulveratus flavus]|uniref:VWA domain-containing protein n=1 Tax=Luteipulveratus flavus TaxID=3031728 RepID=A0ABT6C5F8_9MICO|nr:VWA domain-containing protein [Luteipulveratus sp. YIM 133296]MDF8263532.1 VWA domain-containing protein [Luteipulveratus sp. YIM 133296]